MGFAGGGRAFPGFLGKSETIVHRLSARGALHVDLAADDLLSLHPIEGAQTVSLAVFDSKGQTRTEFLDLAANHTVDVRILTARPLWAGGRRRAAMPR